MARHVTRHEAGYVALHGAGYEATNASKNGAVHGACHANESGSGGWILGGYKTLNYFMIGENICMPICSPDIQPNPYVHP